MMSLFPDARVVVVTGPSWGSALHALRSAKRLGASTTAVVIGTSDRIISASRLCDQSVNVASPAEVKSKILEVLSSSRQTTVVIPLSDALADLLSTLRTDIPDNVILSIPEDKNFRTLLRKADSCALAARAGLHVPPFALVSLEADIATALALPTPVVVRPNSALEPSGDCRKVEVYSDREDLKRRLIDLAGQGAQIIVQTQIAASEDAVEFGMVWRSRDGRCTVVCTGRKRRQSHRDGGVMVWGETEEVREVERATSTLVQLADFAGVGGAEFIRDGETHWFIEFNPRAEAIHFLASAAGLDLIGLEVEHLLTQRIPEVSVQNVAAAWVGSAALERLRSDRWALPRLLCDRWKFARHRVKVRSILDWDDPRPAFELMRLLISRALRLGTVKS